MSVDVLAESHDGSWKVVASVDVAVESHDDERVVANELLVVVVHADRRNLETRELDDGRTDEVKSDVMLLPSHDRSPLEHHEVVGLARGDGVGVVDRCRLDEVVDSSDGADLHCLEVVTSDEVGCRKCKSMGPDCLGVD